jgi:hypothetical protein
MSEPIRSLIALMVSAALLSVAGIIRVNFFGAIPAKAEQGDRTTARSAKPPGTTQPHNAREAT